MTPRWGGAVRKTAKMLESNEWAVFEHCDADFSGTISTAELKARFVEVLGKAGTSLSDAELDAFFEAVDADRDGFVDYDEWQTMVELVKKRAAGDVNAKVLGNPRGTLKVLRPGSIARDAAAMDSEKMCKLKTGTLLVLLEEATLDDGVRRLRVDWGATPLTGWVSAKTVTTVASSPATKPANARFVPPPPPPPLDFRRASSARWEDWIPEKDCWSRCSVSRFSRDSGRRIARRLDAAEEEACVPAKASIQRRPSTALLAGNQKFFNRFGGERRDHLVGALETVETPDSPLSGFSDDSDLSPMAKLRFFSDRLKDDALSATQRQRLREGLLGAEGVAWRREQESRISRGLLTAADALRDNSASPAALARLGRMLYGLGVSSTPDPKAATVEALDDVDARLHTLGGADVLLLSRWANAEAVGGALAARVASPESNQRPRPRPMSRVALDTLVRVATAGALEGSSNADLRDAVADRYNRVSKAHVFVELSPPPNKVWAISDVHVDVHANLKHCLGFASHKDDALLVAGDVAPDAKTFEAFFKSLLPKFRYVFYCPGNHDLWIHEKDAAKNSLDKFFDQLLACDKLGVITHPVRFPGVCSVVPLFSWYTTEFVDGDIESWIRGFDTFCKWPAFLRDDGADASEDVDVDGIMCLKLSTEPGVSRFMARLNDDALKRAPRDEPVISFSHFLPRAVLFEGMGGFKALGHVMGDARLLDQIGRLGSAVHVFGHSHQNVDAVLDGVRYVQNALGHPDCDVPITVHPVVAFDATWVPQKTETVGMFTGAVTRCPKCGD